MQIWESKGSSFISLGVSDLQSLKNNSIINFFKSNNLLAKNEIINFDIVNHIPDDYVCAMVELNHIQFHLQESLKDKINFIRESISQDKIEIDNNQSDYCYIKLNYANLNLLRSSNNKQTKNSKQPNSQKSITFRTKLLVASDGADSTIRSKLNFKTTGHEYNETALICTLRGSEASEIAFQRFLQNGAFALLPLYENLFSIVCSMPKSVNEDLSKMDNSAFLRFVNNVLHNPSQINGNNNKLDLSKIGKSAFHALPPQMEEVLSRKLEFSLQLQYANNPVDKCVVLIGDASHVVHPLAGQGLNLGIMDAAFLADELVKGLCNDRSVNDSQALQAFTYRSQMNSRLMIATIESIRAVYGPTNSLLSALRNIGIAIGNSSEVMRGLFMLSASGIPAQPSKFAWEKSLRNKIDE
jgi:ubiquinone biosynthesis UbiH/UbiF/VisC/COQ6 family hydroxylase